MRESYGRYLSISADSEKTYDSVLSSLVSKLFPVDISQEMLDYLFSTDSFKGLTTAKQVEIISTVSN